jgi:peptidoglycan/xylan/chitin deacetylase (PgdA/CDA1 family)
MKILSKIKFALLASAGVVMPMLGPLQAHALVYNPTPASKVSFTFDDGYASALSQAAPTLNKYGIPGTDYVITKCVGMATAPNTCRANTDATYMTWAQITSLQNSYKWEIGSHTATHPYMATFDATDGQPAPITAAQVTSELTTSKSDLAAHGINATDYASPYGDYNMSVLAQISKYYASQRGFGDTGYNSWPNSDYLIRVQQVQGGVSVAQVKAYVDSAIANKQWLVLVFHDIKTKASNKADDYEYSTSNLDQVAAYVKSKQTAGLITPTTVNQALVTSDTNLMANPSFNNGIADGWTTNAPASVTKDTATNGSYPDPTNSIKMVASATNEHLFSPKIAVSPYNTYGLKTFLNVQKLTSGEVNFYIDEYDANGNWISGQNKASERSAFVEQMNFSYKPTSAAVATASLQISVAANSGITAYLDNSQWFVLTNSAPSSTANLMTNATFDSGIAGGWTTDDSTNVVADALSNGSPANIVNSVKMSSGTVKNSHLFSPQVAVDSTKSYTLGAYVNLKQMNTGNEVGFYVDEYDATGKWISGQYKPGARTIGGNTYGFTYTPSSVNVKKASLQFIVVVNTNTIAYIDNIRWFQN